MFSESLPLEDNDLRDLADVKQAHPVYSLLCAREKVAQEWDENRCKLFCFESAKDWKLGCQDSNGQSEPNLKNLPQFGASKRQLRAAEIQSRQSRNKWAVNMARLWWEIGQEDLEMAGSSLAESTKNGIDWFFDSAFMAMQKEVTTDIPNGSMEQVCNLSVKQCDVPEETLAAKKKEIDEKLLLGSTKSTDKDNDTYLLPFIVDTVPSNQKHEAVVKSKYAKASVCEKSAPGNSVSEPAPVASQM